MDEIKSTDFIEYQTIQAAIDAAMDGDTVLAADGTYTGSGNKNILFYGKAITVKSENGPWNCIIDGENNGRGFNFTNEEGENSVLSGFTIINGYAGLSDVGFTGGGINCHYFSSPTIIDCVPFLHVSIQKANFASDYRL